MDTVTPYAGEMTMKNVDKRAGLKRLATASLWWLVGLLALRLAGA